MTNLSTQQPYCTIINQQHVAVVVFGNELDEWMDYAMDAGDPFWYILGTDAWFEEQMMDGQLSLVARTYDETYFHCPIEPRVIELLKNENGIIVLFPKFPLKAEDIKQTSDLEELSHWMMHEIGEENMDGLIYCFYTEEDKKKYHGEDV
ncbi:hypothetical protein CLV59_101999 [Chitinophaga dinghuensis]|uniref:Uncharacterized protein n=1 Tax=Chitinophaga dinghuensis TaxID=1539050 RepID=A0A327WF81_9BACT|nr:hypothetical protein [Chitinophaga dinghuensis]RAJ88231.1 hypothetical protein CLV59_101999 [Chitinophaga dinghuensis]